MRTAQGRRPRGLGLSRDRIQSRLVGSLVGICKKRGVDSNEWDRFRRCATVGDLQAW